MKRRDFLKVAGGAAAGGAAFAGLLEDWGDAVETKAVGVRSLFDSDGSEVLALAQRVFDKCILDKELLAQSLPRLERFHDWFWRERDVTNIGLIAVGAYSGIVQHAKWETFDYDCAMDGLKLTPHPTRKGPDEGAWYGDICMAGNTAYLILASQAWQTPLPVPTVDRTDKRWKSNTFWRGDVWPPTNYQIASGLAAYGHQELAAVIADKTIANAIKKGISEHYDSVSGQPLGIRDYCMSCTLVTMMLDGLTKTHRLKVKPK